VSQPPTYSRAYNFSDYQATNPSTPVPGNKLDEEFSRIKAVIDAIRANLALVQRDDTAIANESIGYDQLKAELDGFGFNPPSEWATSTNYVVRDTVFHDSGFYRCLVSHTSGTFATDLAAEKWALIADFTAATSDAETAKTAAEAAQAAAEAAQAAAETAETNAAASASAASTSATNAATSATNAATSATNASTSATAAAASATAAATSETNAGTAETAAETAQTAAETAQAAAEAAQAAAEAAAAGVNLPSIVAGDAGKMLRANAGETAYELRSTAQVVSDLGAATVAGTQTLTNKTLTAPVIGSGVKLTEGAAPATATGEGALYTKDSGTQPELYFRSESSGTEVQLTSNGGVRSSVFSTTAPTTASSDFTIPAWANNIRITFYNIAPTTSSIFIIQLGDSGGIETTGYTGTININGTGAAIAVAGFPATGASTTNAAYGSYTLTKVDAGATWAIDGGVGFASSNAFAATYGSKSLSGVLTTLRVKTLDGSNFASGTIGVSYW